MKSPELLFTQNIRETFNSYCAEHSIGKMLILCDINTQQYCLPLLGELNIRHIVIPSGEAEKNLETAAYIMNALIDAGADRQTVLVNLGGGVVSDIGGFAASVFLRGIRFINIPTTLLAMADAAIGGKTGVDHQNLKNYIGTFSQPEAIMISDAFLDTLDAEEKDSAWAEIIKTALIADAGLYRLITDQAPLQQIIAACVKTKQGITDRDFKDENLRQLLNFGHTIGHAYESICLQRGKPVRHGYAVAAGMFEETAFAMFKGVLPQSDGSTILNMLSDKFGKWQISPQDFDLLYPYLVSDKKNADGFIAFSLPDGIGSGKFGIRASVAELKAWKNSNI